jgi:hypothetical protein
VPAAHNRGSRGSPDAGSRGRWQLWRRAGCRPLTRSADTHVCSATHTQPAAAAAAGSSAEPRPAARRESSDSSLTVALAARLPAATSPAPPSPPGPAAQPAAGLTQCAAAAEAEAAEAAAPPARAPKTGADRRLCSSPGTSLPCPGGASLPCSVFFAGSSGAASISGSPSIMRSSAEVALPPESSLPAGPSCSLPLLPASVPRRAASSPESSSPDASPAQRAWRVPRGEPGVDTKKGGEGEGARERGEDTTSQEPRHERASASLSSLPAAGRACAAARVSGSAGLVQARRQADSSKGGAGRDCCHLLHCLTKGVPLRSGVPEVARRASQGCRRRWYKR